MKFSMLVLMAAIALGLSEDNCSPRQQHSVGIASKQGDSCLAENKCKIVVRRWEGGEVSPANGGNVYYQCWVPVAFYQATHVNEIVSLDTSSSNCERMNP
jgi:hypothetical protein